MKKAFFITSFIIFTLAPAVSYAGQYKLVRGSQFELCREFEKNLNSYKGEPPMVCERKINPQFTDFGNPKWKKVDPKEYVKVLEHLVRYTQKHRTEKQFKQAWKKLNKKIDSGKVMLQMSYFDLDHDGTNESVMKLFAYGCKDDEQKSYPWPTDPHMFVVTDNKKELDMRFKRIFSWPYDNFYFKGRAYLARWSGRPKPQLGIFEPFNVRGQMGIQNNPICQYNYVD